MALSALRGTGFFLSAPRWMSLRFSPTHGSATATTTAWIYAHIAYVNVFHFPRLCKTSRHTIIRAPPQLITSNTIFLHNATVAELTSFSIRYCWPTTPKYIQQYHLFQQKTSTGKTDTFQRHIFHFKYCTVVLPPYAHSTYYVLLQSVHTIGVMYSDV